MQQLQLFAFQLSLITWLRSVSSAPHNSSRVDLRMFGLLIALPVLG